MNDGGEILGKLHQKKSLLYLIDFLFSLSHGEEPPSGLSFLQCGEDSIDPSTPLAYRLLECYLALAKADFPLVPVLPIRVVPDCSTADFYKLIINALIEPVRQAVAVHEARDVQAALARSAWSLDINSLRNSLYELSVLDAIPASKARRVVWSVCEWLCSILDRPPYLVFSQAEYLKEGAIHEIRDLHDRGFMRFLLVRDRDKLAVNLERAEGPGRFLNVWFYVQGDEIRLQQGLLEFAKDSPITSHAELQVVLGQIKLEIESLLAEEGPLTIYGEF